MQKLSSFGRGKEIRPKKSLTRLLHEALQFLTKKGIIFRFSITETYIVVVLRGAKNL